MSDPSTLEQEILSAVAAARDETALEAVRVAALGKSGSVSALLSTLGSDDAGGAQGRGAAHQRPQGSRHRGARGAPRSAASTPRSMPASTPRRVDVTLPVREPPAETGRIHPISQVIDELTAIFADMGFAVAEGPDIETDDYNFTKLNFPEGHPAREMHDTFFFNPKPDGSRMLLRTHTSPVQVRTMLSAEAADPRHHSGPHLPHAIPTRPTRRCSIRSRAWSSTRARISAT